MAKSRPNGEEINERRQSAAQQRTGAEVVSIRPNIPQPSQLSKSKNRGSLPIYLWSGAVLAADNIREGLAGLYDSNIRGVLNPNATRTHRGTPRQKVAALAAASLTVLTGVKTIPPVLDSFSQTPGESFVQNMYKNESHGTQAHDGVLPTRISWVVESYGPDGANILSENGINMIELVGTYPSKSEYKDERQKVEAGFTALDRISDVVSAQGFNSDGTVRGFDLSDDSQARLSGTFAGYVADAVDAGMVDNKILGDNPEVDLLKLNPDDLLQVFARTPDAATRADYLLDHGRNGSVPVIPPPIDLGR